MKTFYLTRALLEQIEAHAAAAAPDECVGLLFGQAAQVDRVQHLPNVSPTPQTRFLADPQTLFTALQDADGRGEQLVGNYHSHPRTDAFPSLGDLAGAHGETVQLIVGQDAVRVFRLGDGAATELELKLL